MKLREANINGIKIDLITYTELIEKISISLKENKKTVINYANANSINLSFKNKLLTEFLSASDIIHPDGIGIKYAINFLYGKKTLANRFTGSDFYPLLIRSSINNNYRLFFFGHDSETLGLIAAANPALKIAGKYPGYGFNTADVLNSINSSKAEIVIIGLGTPLQEKWIYENKEKINSKVIISVGEGIKVFAGTKHRGPLFIRKAGLEWLYRVLINPLKYFNRYIIGNPLFLYRIIKIKMRKLA